MAETSLTDRDRLVRVPAGDDELRAAVAGTDVPVAGVGPTGVRSLDPLVAATLDGRTAFYPNCTADRATEIASALADGDLATDGAGVVEHDPAATTLPVADLRGLDVGTRQLLGGCGWRRPASPEDHRAAGGFRGDGAGGDTDAEEILALASDLRGRGWGDWRRDEPIGGDWERLREDDRRGDGAAVVVNAHGTAADTLLAESVPFEVLEGAQLAARTVRADGVVVYLSGADERAVEWVQAAADAYPDPAAPVEVVTGPSVYRAAEPTMALEAIEGNHRLEARLTPGDEFPTLHGAPALVHTARTYAHLAVGLRTDGRDGDGDGNADENDSAALPETRLVTVSGDVGAPATVELPGTAALDRALEAVELAGGFKAACVGGRFGGLTDSLDVAVDPDALAGAGLGTEGVVEVLSTDRCVLEFAGKRTQFAAETNCGRCVPCREGSKQLANLLRDVYDGDYDDAGIAELVRVMEGSSICGFGVDAGRPARTAMDAFDAEIEAHADGRCPTGSCAGMSGAGTGTETEAEVHT